MEYNEGFSKQHEVMILLKKISDHAEDDPCLKMHLAYYKSLYNQKKVAKYGMVLYDGSVCILLDVLSDIDFGLILQNDPTLGILFEIEMVIPFRSEDKYDKFSRDFPHP